jgi:hypothetical protein
MKSKKQIMRERRMARHSREKTRLKFWHNVFVIKVTIGVGLGLALVLPEGHRELAFFALNQLWLWKV